MYMYAKIAVDFETKNKKQTHNYIKMFITRLLQAIGYTQKHFICGNPDESNVCPIHWSQVFLVWKWRCSWSSADRQCSDFIWVINNFVAYWGATYKSRFDGISVCRIAKFGNSCECCQYYYIHRHGLISVDHNTTDLRTPSWKNMAVRSWTRTSKDFAWIKTRWICKFFL